MKIKHVVSLIICVLLFVTMSLMRSSISSIAEPTIYQEQDSNNLLINGNFDVLGFYWRPTNSWVGGGWFQWWRDYNAIPEYIDGGIDSHNECYPKPPDNDCHKSGYYNSSQGIIKWGGAPYKAGVYKPVVGVYPCALYTFEMWNRNDADAFLYNPYLGVDPTGWVITQPGASPPSNCPPDGISNCPDPYVALTGGLPDTFIWSDMLTQPRYVWGKGSMTFEALNTTISVWTITSPDANQVAKTTYWDNGSVVFTPFPDDRLPAPAAWASTGFIYNVQTGYAGSDVIITWDTTLPASTQLWFDVMSPATPYTTTEGLTNTVYMPNIQRIVYPENYRGKTPIEYEPTLSHEAVISGLIDGDVLSFVPLSRYVENNVCKTVSYEPTKWTINLP